MDPNACLERLIRAILTDDFDESRAAYVDLLTWCRAGGFSPDRFQTEPTLANAFGEGMGALMLHVRGMKIEGIAR